MYFLDYNQTYLFMSVLVATIFISQLSYLYRNRKKLRLIMHDRWVNLITRKKAWKMQSQGLSGSRRREWRMRLLLLRCKLLAIAEAIVEYPSESETWIWICYKFPYK